MGIEIGPEDANLIKMIFSDIYIIYWSCWVGEALEKEDVEEPEDIASEYVIIYVDKIYMYTL